MSLRNHSWRDVIKVLQHFGFQVYRQKGSHIHLMNIDGKYGRKQRNKENPHHSWVE